MKSSDEIREELEELEREATVLKRHKEKLTEELELTDKRLRDLNGHPWGGARDRGLIGSKRAEMEAACRREKHETFPRVVWKVAPRYCEKELVVTRVTKKRIFVSEIGGFRESQYNRDGTPVGWGDQVIDVEATLGGDQLKSAPSSFRRQWSGRSWKGARRKRGGS
ncbi:MAG: hypothetical protein NXI32_04100 [bacterium]|nr:hypothetical protein [bacterium]